jgi:hypothetical protein
VPPEGTPKPSTCGRLIWRSENRSRQQTVDRKLRHRRDKYTTIGNQRYAELGRLIQGVTAACLVGVVELSREIGGIIDMKHARRSRCARRLDTAVPLPLDRPQDTVGEALAESAKLAPGYSYLSDENEVAVVEHVKRYDWMLAATGPKYTDPSKSTGAL